MWGKYGKIQLSKSWAALGIIFSADAANSHPTKIIAVFPMTADS